MGVKSGEARYDRNNTEDFEWGGKQVGAIERQAVLRAKVLHEQHPQSIRRRKTLDKGWAGFPMSNTAPNHRGRDSSEAHLCR